MVRRRPRALAGRKSGTVIGLDSTGVPQDALNCLCAVWVAGVMQSSPYRKNSRPDRKGCLSYDNGNLRRIIAAVVNNIEVSMANKRIRIGIVGAGANTRLRHIPGLREQPDVDIVAVCNRRPESSSAIAREFSVPRTYSHLEEL